MLAPERNSFGIIRLAMALCVLDSHCFFLAAGSSQQEPLAWTGYTLGDYGVQVFFILSGILVTQSLARSGDVFDFAIARVLRIEERWLASLGFEGIVQRCSIERNTSAVCIEAVRARRRFLSQQI